jgi:hypothetical protein
MSPKTSSTVTLPPSFWESMPSSMSSPARSRKSKYPPVKPEARLLATLQWGLSRSAPCCGSPPSAPQAQWELAPRFTGVPMKRPLLLGVEAWGSRGQHRIRRPVGTTLKLPALLQIRKPTTPVPRQRRPPRLPCRSPLRTITRQTRTIEVGESHVLSICRGGPVLPFLDLNPRLSPYPRPVRTRHSH